MLIPVARIMRSPRFLASELASELYVDGVVDGEGRLCYVDRVVSVSALPETEADAFYGVQMELPFSEGDPHGS